MEYATRYQSADNSASQGQKAGSSLRSIGQLLSVDGTTKGRRRNPKGQTAVGSGGDVANGFLRASFLPRLEETENIENYRKHKNMEGDFFSSLSILAEQRNIEPRIASQLSYPYNIAFSLAELIKQPENGYSGRSETRLIEHGEHYFFAKEEYYNVGMVLYYIPVEPLFLMLGDVSRKHTAELILSVFSYLYHIADIPYYRQESSYLYEMYEMVTQWKEEDEEEDEEFFAEREKADTVGDFIEERLRDLDNLNGFKNRLSGFNGKDSFDKDCNELAEKFWKLYQQYPDTPAYRNIRIDPNDEDAEEQTVGFEKYISFCASCVGTLFDNVFDAINVNLQECCTIQEPTIYIPFDGRIIEGNDLDFEQRLFALVDDLVALLNDYKKLRS